MLHRINYEVLRMDFKDHVNRQLKILDHLNRQLKISN